MAKEMDKDKQLDDIINQVLDNEMPVEEWTATEPETETPTEPPIEPIEPETETPAEPEPTEPEPTEPEPTEPKPEPTKPTEPEAPTEPEPEVIKDGEVDINALIEKELGVMDKTKDAVEEIQEEILSDEKVKWTELYRSLDDKFRNLNTSLEERNADLETVNAQLKKFKSKLGEVTGQMADRSMEDIMSKPILDVIEADTDLKGAILSKHKADQTGEEVYKTQALDKLYDFIQKESGINIKELIGQQQSDETSAMGVVGGGESNVNVIPREAPKDKEDSIIDMALGV